MAGVKGRSGRKSWDKETSAKELWDLSVPVLKSALRAPEKIVSLTKKVDIALALVNKMMPTKIEGEGFDSNINLLNYPEIDPETRRRILERVRAGRG